jgi:serine phosphatase RsbU (regulator of sigma subunit)
MLMTRVSLIILLMISLHGYSQDYRKLQQLKQVVLQSPKDTVAIHALSDTLYAGRKVWNSDTLLFYNLFVYESSKKVHYENGVASTASALGNAYTASGDYSKSLVYLFEAEKIYTKNEDHKRLAGIYNIIGNTYLGTGNLEGQKIYFSKCYEIGLKHDLQTYKAYGAGGLGNYYSALKNFESSNKWMILACGLFKNSPNKIAYAICLVNIATNYRMLHNIVKADEYVALAKDAAEAADFNYATYLYYKEVGDIYMERHVYDLAIKNYNSALGLMIADKANHNISEIYKSMAEASVKAKQYPQAVDFLQSHIQYKDSVFNENNNKQLVDVKEKYETEKKDAEINILNKENALSQSELNRKKVLIYSVVAVALLLLVLFVFVIRSNVQKNKTNALLEKQKVIIEEKQKEILDSINYAKRIQYTLLANREMLNKLLPGCFIFFEPKDIVSGDFYWATYKDNFIYLAVCDCTGHGVPGAFMSLLSSNLLNEAINEKQISDPGQVLDYVRERLINSLDGGNDGMDAILVKLPVSVNGAEKTQVQYASANNKLVKIHKQQLEEFATNKMPVGKGEKKENFTTQVIDVHKGDVMYLYTDGYADQFGGEKGKKFKYKTLNQLLVSISELSPKEQEQKLRETFISWKGPLEQVDDVCVMGIKI